MQHWLETLVPIKTHADNACCDGYKWMLCWISAFYDVGAVHFCERKVQSNTSVCLLNCA